MATRVAVSFVHEASRRLGAVFDFRYPAFPARLWLLRLFTATVRRRKSRFQRNSVDGASATPIGQFLPSYQVMIEAGQMTFLRA